jgi:ribosomal subunit interface protein
MKMPLQVTFRNMSTSEAMEADIRERAEKLEQFCDAIISCRVVVEAQTNRHRQGNLFRIAIDLKVPDREIVASKADADPAHEDAYVAIRDAFDNARRQLEDYNKRRQGL